MNALRACLFLTLFLFSSAQAQTVQLSIAASMTDASQELLNQFAKKHPKDVFIPNFASSGNLARQIENGAPADIYISANPKWMDYLNNIELIDRASRRTLAYNSLVFIGPQTTQARNIDSLVHLQRIALGNPQSVPAGQYAKVALTAVGVYQNLRTNHKLIFSKDVRQALLYADRGEVDGAFVYKTDAFIASTAKILFTVDAELHPRIQYPIALTESGSKKPLAREFLQFTTTKDAARILEKYGFEKK